MIALRENSKNHRKSCDNCSAVEGKKHPHGFFTVHLRKRLIDGRMLNLCRRCRNEAKGRFHDRDIARNFLP